MTDLVGTVPKNRWLEWLDEGDLAGDCASGEFWGWFTSHWLAADGRPGDRFYVVAHGKLRGFAPIVRVIRSSGFQILRQGGAVACTIDEPIRGFQGLRHRWWRYEEERPFPEWRMP